MELNTQQLEVELLEAVLYDEKTGELQPADERAQCLDVIRLKIVELGGMFEDMDDVPLHVRVIMFQTFARVTETYLGIVEKHEEFVAAGK